MTWNYRVIKQLDSNSDIVYYGIHEVYYSESGQPHSCSADPIYPYGESFEELNSDFEKMKVAFSQPVLDMDLFDKKI